MIFKSLFHFLGGIYFAVFLIAFSALAVIAGTFLESITGSHLYAARWTYGHSGFLLLLSLFFINILFSALRRWPFKKKHLPFLMTHLGLLMILSGTMIKNRFGLQGQLSIWEGGGNQHVLLPNTYSISIEGKEKESTIPLDSFKPNIYFPFDFPHLKFKMIGYAPHVKEKMESWIKDSKATIAGFPSVPVHKWNLGQPFPESKTYSSSIHLDPWSILALQTSNIREAIEQAYSKELELIITPKEGSSLPIKIPLQKALQEPFGLGNGSFSLSLNSHFSLEDQDVPTLHLVWKKGDYIEKLTLPLSGGEALLPQSESTISSFNVDLVRPRPLLLLIENGKENTLFFSSDTYGRIYQEKFSLSTVETLVAYDQGFRGYGVQAVVPFPSFPASRKDKRNGEEYALKLQLQQALNRQIPMISPLQFFEKGCQNAAINFTDTFVQFLKEWEEAPSLLFHPVSPLSPNLEHLLKNLDWKEVPDQDRQAALWIRQLFDQLELSIKNGEELFTILEKHRWPLLKELREQSKNQSPFTILSQQIAALILHLPPIDFHSSPPVHEQAALLSAYLKGYGIDYRSMIPIHRSTKEPFDSLDAYWKKYSPEKGAFSKEIVFETSLTHQLEPDFSQIKVEDQRPGVVLEVQNGGHKQTIALAYDPTGIGLKWPLINEDYLVRFQPKFQKIPHRLRLREAREIFYPESTQVYSYESDMLISESGQSPTPRTLSMNQVYETLDGYRFYLGGVGTSADGSLKKIQLAVNHDPAKYYLTYPGAAFVFAGIILLFWIFPYFKKSTPD